ncbi:MAG TPA: COX15/CtaA family protein [Acidimicrobiia bacterium]|nr:COX15/CtaA family protein [Acidimicrobiia bacterium]
MPPRARFPTVSPRTYRALTVFALAALAFIVLSGAAVRLTGSGLGCSEWPNCEPGSLVPRGESTHHDWIEFVNRTITGLVSVAIALAVLGAHRRRPRRRDLVRISWGLVAGLVAQIVLGGLTVIFDLWPPLVMGHFLLSMVALWNALWLHHRAGEPDGVRVPAAPAAVVPWVRGVVACTAVVVFLGTVVTASGPHAGDADVDRLGPDLPDVARLHGIAVVILLLVLAGTLRAVRDPATPAPLAATVRMLLFALLAQGAIGYVQYFSGVPAGLVEVHVGGAIVVWLLALRASLLLHTRPSDATTPTSPSPDPRARVGATATLR